MSEHPRDRLARRLVLCLFGYSDGGREGPDDAQDQTIDGRTPRRVLAYVTRSPLAEPLQIYAAGSLTAAFTDIVKAFPAAEGDVAAPVFGPSGVLREKIEHGDHVDVFASADMEQPRTLARSRPRIIGRDVHAQPVVRAGTSK